MKKRTDRKITRQTDRQIKKSERGTTNTRKEQSESAGPRAHVPGDRKIAYLVPKESAYIINV